MWSQGFGNWMLWAWVAVVATGILAAVATRLLQSAPRARLPLRHVAGATLIGVVGWTALLSLPSVLMQFSSSVGQIAAASGDSVYLAYTVAAFTMIGASVIAVIGILRRRPWGIVLGIGMAIAHVGTSILGAIGWLAVIDRATGNDGNLVVFAATYLLGAVPALVAIALLLVPIGGRQVADRVRDRHDRPVDAGADGAPNDAAAPDWNAPARDRT